MVEIRTRKELYDYLNGVDWSLKKDNSMASVYFLVEFDGHTEPIYFFNYADSWFECPCELHRYPLPDNQVKDLVKELYEENSWLSAYEYEINFQKHGYHYEINNPQCTPFLPEKFNILDMISESECLIWLMDKYEPKMCANTDMAIYILEFIKQGYAKNYQDAGVTKYLEALQMGINALEKTRGDTNNEQIQSR